MKVVIAAAPHKTLAAMPSMSKSPITATHLKKFIAKVAKAWAKSSAGKRVRPDGAEDVIDGISSGKVVKAVKADGYYRIQFKFTTSHDDPSIIEDTVAGVNDALLKVVLQEGDWVTNATDSADDSVTTRKGTKEYNDIFVTMQIDLIHLPTYNKVWQKNFGEDYNFKKNDKGQKVQVVSLKSLG